MTTLRTQEQGYPCQIWMSKLYDIFQKEKNYFLPNASENASLLYSDAKSSLQYKDSDGTMTVIFSKKGNEDIYFRPADAPKHSGLGTKICSLSNYGKNCDYNIEDENDIPPQFQCIIDRYRTSRAEIGISPENPRTMGRMGKELGI